MILVGLVDDWYTAPGQDTVRGAAFMGAADGGAVKVKSLSHPSLHCLVGRMHIQSQKAATSAQSIIPLNTSGHNSCTTSFQSFGGIHPTPSWPRGQKREIQLDCLARLAMLNSL